MGRGKRPSRKDSYLEWKHHEDSIKANPERARCCPAPDFAIRREDTYKQRCRTCRTWHTGASLEAIKTLEVFEASKCPHVDLDLLDILGIDRFGQPFQCKSCRLCWRQRPAPHAAGEEFETFYGKWMDEWEVATGLIHLRMQNAAAAAARPTPRSRTSSLSG